MGIRVLRTDILRHRVNNFFSGETESCEMRKLLLVAFIMSFLFFCRAFAGRPYAPKPTMTAVAELKTTSFTKDSYVYYLENGVVKQGKFHGFGPRSADGSPTSFFVRETGALFGDDFRLHEPKLVSLVLPQNFNVYLRNYYEENYVVRVRGTKFISSEVRAVFADGSILIRNEHNRNGIYKRILRKNYVDLPSFKNLNVDDIVVTQNSPQEKILGPALGFNQDGRVAVMEETKRLFRSPINTIRFFSLEDVKVVPLTCSNMLEMPKSPLNIRESALVIE